MKNNASKAKGTKAKAKKAGLGDLKPSKADATKGGATTSTRFDPYKNFKFRP
jgi:hypothetical protein